MQRNAENLSGDRLGGNNNNMPPQNHSPLEKAADGAPSDFHISGGIDWLELCIYADLNNCWGEFSEKLEEHLTVAKDSGEEQILHYIDGKFFAVQSWGAKIGNMIYPYRAIDNHEVTWYFRNSPDVHKTIPNIRLRISGEQCLIHDTGVEGLVEHVFETLRGLKANVHKIGVSRVDLCLDIAGLHVETFKYLHFNNHFSTRAKSHSGCEVRDDDSPDSIDKDTWRYLKSNGWTFYYGRTPLQLRVYDKLAELNHKLKPRKWQGMINRRWGGKVPECATRVEFEIRREKLKEYGIDTIQDLFDKKSALVNELCLKWFRYTTEDVTQTKNAQRVPTHSKWEMIQDGFDEVYEGSIDHNLSPLPKEECDVSALAKQALGVILKCAECQGEQLNSFAEFMKYSAELMRQPALAKKAAWVPMWQKLQEGQA